MVNRAPAARIAKLHNQQKFQGPSRLNSRQYDEATAEISFPVVFLWSSVVIISLGVISKLLNLFGPSLVHEGSDPILPLPETYRDAIIVLLEICALTWLWLARSKPVQQGMCVTVLGGTFVIYHVALGIASIPGSCPCFGSVWRDLGLSEEIVRVVAAALAWTLFCNGIARLTWSD